MSRSETSDVPIGEIEKNRKERLHVSISNYRGLDLINFRVWYLDEKTGEWQPGRQGVALRIELLPQLTNLVQQAQLIAQQRNLLPNPEPVPPKSDAEMKRAAGQLASAVFGRSGQRDG